MLNVFYKVSSVGFCAVLFIVVILTFSFRIFPVVLLCRIISFG
jgi:hypothetical protein